MLSKRFYDRFRGLDRAHGVFKITHKNASKNKMEGKAFTAKGVVNVELWQKHLSGEQGVGIISITDEGTSFWGAIDIDIYPIDLYAIEEKIKELKLPLILCKTKSGGAHLYLFLSEETPAQLVQEKLMEWAVALGYPGVEVFPKQVKLANKDDTGTGNWLNMPYFHHEKLEESSRYGFRDHKILSAEEFLDFADEYQVNQEQLKQVQVFTTKDLEQAPPCLQYLCTTGFPEGTRNKGLFNLAILAKQKFGDHWKQKVDEFNAKFMKPPLTSAEVQTIIKSAERKNYFYTCSDEPVVSYCQKAICLTRKFGIGNAADDLGVLLNGLTKINTTPPTWIVAINGIRIELESTDFLLNQTNFRQLCVERVNILPNRVKAPAWESAIKNLLSHVEIIEAPEDASPVGQLLHLVEDFCLSRATARTKDEMVTGKPYKEDGNTYFRSSDLMKFLSQRRFREIDKANKVWNVLREHGGSSKQLSIGGRSYRVWSIPSPQERKLELNPPSITEKEEF